MSKTRATVAAGLVLVGATIAIVFSPPFVRWSGARTRALIDRALEPVAVIQAEDLAGRMPREIDVLIPHDDQWARIQRRLGAPDFLILAALDWTPGSQTVSGANVDKLAITASIDGRPVALRKTTDLPYGYTWKAPQEAYRFAASPGDRVRLSAGARSSLPPDSRLIILVRWDPLEQWDWMDSNSIGQGLTEAVAPCGMGLGLLMFAIGGWIYRARKRVADPTALVVKQMQPGRSD